MKDITVTIIQTDLVWESVDTNLTRFDQLLNDITCETDLVVLPEMFSTGFSMNPQQLSQSMRGKCVSWIRQAAIRHKTCITGSMIINENDRYYNRLIWAFPDGTLKYYDKKHLFRMAGEDKVYSAGSHHLTIELCGWKIRPFICYDLRFPGWLRNLNNAYDLAVFVANWPQKRRMHWNTLLRARAIENQCYVIGVNRIGKDGKGIEYSGDSQIIEPDGNILFQARQQPIVQTQTLNFKALDDYRRGFPAWMDADIDLFKQTSQIESR